MQWSSYQQAIFQDVAEGTGHTVVIARAGSGKTTTIMEALKFVPAECTALLVAFNKSIATELESRVERLGNPRLAVSTLHSYGYAAVRRAFGKVKVDANKVKWILNDLYDNIELPFDQRLQVMKAVSLCKAQLVEDAEGIDKLVDAYSLDVPTESAERNSFIRKVLNVLERSRKDTARVDFDDMIWMPVVLGLKLDRYDRVFIDETQDLNAAQIELALGACKDGGRICAVGDDRQAIYAFRGADSQAIPNIVARLQAKELYLSVTYRCALSIVKQAQNYVPDLQAASNAAEGVVTFADKDHMMREVRPGDFILSRTNAPLVRTCLQLIRERRPATIQGRDIGAGLIALIKKSREKTVSDFLEWLDMWERDEITRLRSKDMPTQTVEDKAACLRVLCEGETLLSNVKVEIENLFSDDTEGNRIILSSTHKAKGLERERVFLLRDTYLRPKLVQANGREEENLFYVAITRAKSELVFVQETAA